MALQHKMLSRECFIQLRRPLPVALRCVTYKAIHRIGHQTEGQRAVALAAIIFQPRGLGRVLVKVARSDLVMPTNHHATQAREIAFCPVGVLAVVAVGNAVVDTVNRPARVPHIPVRRLVSRQRSHTVNILSCTSDAPSTSATVTMGRVRPRRSCITTTTRRYPFSFSFRRRPFAV